MTLCIVAECYNDDSEGKFVGQLCAPCHTAITLEHAAISSINADNFIKRLPWLEKYIASLETCKTEAQEKESKLLGEITALKTLLKRYMYES